MGPKGTKRAFISVCIIGALMPFLVLYLGQQGREYVIDSQRESCSVVRTALLAVYTAQHKAAKIIAGDPFQSEKTRAARSEEADALLTAMTDLRRDTAQEDGKVDCDKIFPSTPLIPVTYQATTKEYR